MIFAACVLLCFLLSLYFDVFSNGFSNSDEPSHFVNSYFIRHYIYHGQLSNPMAFAEQFYISYPKLTIGHWPPLYYLFVGGVFLIFPPLPEVAVWINLLVVALIATLCGLPLYRRLGPGWTMITALAFILLPLSIESLNFFMLDQPLTLIVLLAAWAWQRFSSQPSYGGGILFGALAAAAILIKGNGWLLGLFPIFHILFARRWALLKSPPIYVGALFCFIPVLPWYLLTAKISAKGFNYAFGPAFAWDALTQNLLTLYHNVGFFGMGLAIFALIRLWNSGNEQTAHDERVRIAASMIAAVLLLQSLIPVAIVDRYMSPAIPFLLMLVILGTSEIARLSWLKHHPSAICRCVQAIAIFLFLLPALSNLSNAEPYADLRMTESAKAVVDPQQVQVVVVDGSPMGEGAFIAEALVASKAKGLYVVRSSKIFSESNFMGTEYRLTVQTASDIGSILHHLGASHVVLERLEDGKRFPHNHLVEQFLSAPESGYHKQLTLKHRWRPGMTHIYAADRTPKANIAAVQRANFPKKRKMF